jgi:hypothetical protein
MATAVIHVVPDDSSTTGSCAATLATSSATYLTREAAERVAEAIAQQRETQLVVHLPDGRTTCRSFAKG